MKNLPLSPLDKSILGGNLLDHFDTSLYGFLAPLLGPIFFPNTTPVVQLILAYSVMATSLVTRPLGALLFGAIAWRKGPIYSLSYSLIGVALATMSIGFLPSYAEAGWVAPALLVLIRMIKGIFAAGESTVSKLYILENKSHAQGLKASYLYQSSSMVGIILASAVATLMISYDLVEWRTCFWLGGSAGFMAYFLRRYSSQAIESASKTLFQEYGASYVSKVHTLWAERINIINTAVVCGFSHLTYGVPFILMNALVPLLTKISLGEMMALNTALLIVDLLLIPVLGQISLKYSPVKIMGCACFVLGVTTVPLFQGLPGASLSYVTFVRFWFIIWGVLFSCPLNYWLGRLFKNADKYLCVGLGNAFGVGILARSLTPFCLWLYYTNAQIFWPALYLTLIAGITAIALYITKTK